jgi:hypothetical protein
LSGGPRGRSLGGGPNNTDELKVAAIVDWYGITDVAELLSGPNMRSYAVAWLGPNRMELAKQLKHGGFTDGENLKAYAAIRALLGKFNLPATTVESTRAGAAR